MSFFENFRNRPRLFGQRNSQATVEAMKADFRVKWQGRGATAAQVDKALSLADGWAQSLAEFTAPDPATGQAILEKIYPKALQTADSWISSIMTNL